MTMQVETESRAQAMVRAKRNQLRFESLPATYIHPKRLGDCLPRGLPDRFREQLVTSARLQRRLSDILIRRFNLPPCSVHDADTPEARFARLEGRDLGQMVRRIGAIWHGRTLRAIIMASALKDLIGWLGQDSYRAALRHGALAGADIDREVVVGEKPDIDRLCRLIETDGQRCVKAWCAEQPASLATRLLLKFPPVPDAEEGIAEPFRERGLLITDRVVMELAADDGAPD